MLLRAVLLAAALTVAIGCEQPPDAPSVAEPTISPDQARAATARVGRHVDPDRPDVVVLRGRDNELEIEILQNGRRIARRDGAYRLDAAPFTVRLRGDVRAVSYVATVNPDKTAPLERLERPLVFFAGSGGVWPGDALALMHEDEITIHNADAEFFEQQWIARPARARELADYLDHVIGRTPDIATFRHYYLGVAGPIAAARQEAGEHLPATDETAVAEFRIETVAQRPVGHFPKVRLVMFLHSPVGQTFSQVAWETFDLHFD